MVYHLTAVKVFTQTMLTKAKPKTNKQKTQQKTACFGSLFISCTLQAKRTGVRKACWSPPHYHALSALNTDSL